MSTKSVKSISKVSVKRQLSIYGYIRELENLFSICIPEGIVMILITFYGNGQRFDPKLVGKAQKLDEDNQIVDHIEGYYTSSTFCEPIMESKEDAYKWTFEINKDSGGGNVCIGICQSKQNGDLPLNSWFPTGGYRGYVIDLRFKRLWYPTKGDGNQKYRSISIPEMKRGDIIEMNVDLKAKKLSYTINMKQYDQLNQDIEVGEYRAGIWMYCQGNALKLIQE